MSAFSAPAAENSRSDGPNASLLRGIRLDNKLRRSMPHFSYTGGSTSCKESPR